MSETKKRLQLYKGEKKVGTVFKSKKTTAKGRSVGKCYKIVKAKVSIRCPPEMRKSEYKYRPPKKDKEVEEEIMSDNDS